jgi:hypothetical protein
MIEIFNLRRIAPYYKTVTITGETGSARKRSPRRSTP